MIALMELENTSFIAEFEFEFALKKMKAGKTLEQDCILIEGWKCLGKEGVPWLTKLFNKILMIKKLSD